MATIYDVAQGTFVTESDATPQYSPEVECCGWHPIVEEIHALRLQAHNAASRGRQPPSLPVDLVDADGDAFLRSFEK